MIRSFFSSSALILIGLVCASITQILFARFLGAEEYGVYSFIFSISLILSVFSLFGFQNSAVKIISIFQARKDKNQTRSFYKFSLFFCLCLSLIISIAIYGILSQTHLTDTYPKEVFFLGIIATPLMVFMRLHAAYLRGLSKASFSVLFETSLREVLLLIGISILFFIGVGLEKSTNALFLLILSLTLSCVVAWGITRIYLKNQPLPSKKIERTQKKEWLSLSFPMMLTIFAQRLLRRSDIILLGFMTSPLIVGAYAIAAQFSEASTIGQKGVYAIFSPKVAALHEAKKKKELQKFYTKIQWLSILSTGIICLCIGMLTPFILSFFGDDFAIAHNSILILLTGQFFNICFGPVALLMLMTGREKQAMMTTFIIAIANLILNPMAIHFYGMEGAAITTTSLLILRAAVNYYDVKKQGII